MKIVSIFEHSKESLFAVKYEGEDLDALEILQEQWSDVEFLRDFFMKFKKDYESYYPKAKLNKIVLQQLKMQMPYLSCFMIWQRIRQENP